MLNLIFPDLRLLFPNVSESIALLVSSIQSLVSLALVILLIVAQWKLFQKMGEKPWKSLIPFYSAYVLYKRTWSVPAFWTFIISSTAFDCCILSSEAMTFVAPDSPWVGALLLIALPFGIVASVNSILSGFRIAESFGKGVGFGVGMIFFYTVFTAILGFGKAEYVGIDGEPEQPDAVVDTEPEKEAVTK